MSKKRVRTSSTGAGGGPGSPGGSAATVTTAAEAARTKVNGGRCVCCSVLPAYSDTFGNGQNCHYKQGVTLTPSFFV